MWLENIFIIYGFLIKQIWPSHTHTHTQPCSPWVYSSRKSVPLPFFPAQQALLVSTSCSPLLIHWTVVKWQRLLSSGASWEDNDKGVDRMVWFHEKRKGKKSMILSKEIKKKREANSCGYSFRSSIMILFCFMIVLFCLPHSVGFVDSVMANETDFCLKDLSTLRTPCSRW